MTARRPDQQAQIGPVGVEGWPAEQTVNQDTELRETHEGSEKQPDPHLDMHIRGNDGVAGSGLSSSWAWGQAG